MTWGWTKTLHGLRQLLASLTRSLPGHMYIGRTRVVMWRHMSGHSSSEMTVRGYAKEIYVFSLAIPSHSGQLSLTISSWSNWSTFGRVFTKIKRVPFLQLTVSVDLIITTNNNNNDNNYSCQDIQVCWCCHRAGWWSVAARVGDWHL